MKAPFIRTNDPTVLDVYSPDQKLSVAEQMYMSGWKASHYPVPAIRRTVEYGTNWMVIANWTNGQYEVLFDGIHKDAQYA